MTLTNNLKTKDRLFLTRENKIRTFKPIVMFFWLYRQTEAKLKKNISLTLISFQYKHCNFLCVQKREEKDTQR